MLNDVKLRSFEDRFQLVMQSCQYLHGSYVQRDTMLTASKAMNQQCLTNPDRTGEKSTRRRRRLLGGRGSNNENVRNHNIILLLISSEKSKYISQKTGLFFYYGLLLYCCIYADVIRRKKFRIY